MGGKDPKKGASTFHQKVQVIETDKKFEKKNQVPKMTLRQKTAKRSKRVARSIWRPLMGIKKTSMIFWVEKVAN